MQSSRRKFLQASTAAALATASSQSPLKAAAPVGDLNPSEIARRHAFLKNSPTPGFFEGMLLGNGDVGLCVTARPDGLGLHIGKNDCWDIRVSDHNHRYLMNNSELLKLWRLAGDQAKRMRHPKMIELQDRIPVFRDYTEMAGASYRKKWPHPWPCGSIWIHWDPRLVRIDRQLLDPSSGLLTVDLVLGDTRRVPGSPPLAAGPFSVPGKRLRLKCFVDWDTGLISVSTDSPAPFSSVAYYPNYQKEAMLPAPEVDGQTEIGSGLFSCLQRLPFTAPTKETPYPPPSPKDQNFALYGKVAGKWNIPQAEPIFMRAPWLERSVPHAWLQSAEPQPFRLDVMVMTPRDHPQNVKRVRESVQQLARTPVTELRKRSAARWEGFWSKSAVEFQDRELEKIWYHNQYFLACCLREGKVAPGLAGNWITKNVGTSWHGDYHFDYNVEQVYWGVFSSNHTDQHFPYINLIEHLLPAAEARAQKEFGLPGADFPLSAYPVSSTVSANPAPPWVYLICDTPWAVQSLWWHYRYTMDEELLRRVYPALRAAAQFIASYAKKGSDGHYHIAPTLSPENFGLTVDFRFNRDCIVDLALSRFLLAAVIEASQILGEGEEERNHWKEVHSNLAAYSQIQGPFGRVWLDVADGPAEWIFNTPNTLAPVFPGEQVGIDSHPGSLDIARRTAETIRLEGGNDLVFQPLCRARLGILDLNWFKQQVRYCLLPNGIANDRVRQSGGRYTDQTDFDFMMRMLVWVENFSLPAVLNECMLQSYSGTLHLFPNTHGMGPARFQNLRAAGAFLVSASWDGKEVSLVTLLSEKGTTAKIASPWGSAAGRVIQVKNNAEVETRKEKGILIFDTKPNEYYRLQPA